MPASASHRRAARALVAVALVVAGAAAAAGPAVAAPATAPAGAACTPRLLVLSAFPAELGGLLAAANVDPAQTVNLGGHSFYLGSLAGNQVILALTGIGMTNATRTTQSALDHFRCPTAPGVSGVVFSGVAGSRAFIGDVTVPAQWTADGGATWLAADPTMLATARGTAAAATAKLERNTPLGDPACVCIDPHLVKTVHLRYAPQVIAGGDGITADPFGGRAFPCIPAGGDVFGCTPCHAPDRSAGGVTRFLTGILPFVDPAFFLSYLAAPSPPTTGYDASDMETAAVARVASANAIPFIAFRAVSDGQGDPLKLPGFPAQFFVYRQLAADNAATAALEFLTAWGVTHP